MASTPYHYEPLTSESSFRLFCLKKAQPDLAGLFDMINIHLFDASLENPPKFEAVSYAWNHQGLDSTILCNDQPLHVASNVVSILRALQHRDSPGILWVDSICIDQSSTREKNLQVPKMCSIYRQAEKVWIWLGEGSYETDVTFNFLAEVAAIIQRSDSLGERCRWLKKPLELFAAKVRKRRGVNDAADTSFIVDILHRPWFHRTWTVQELVLARDAVLLCGSMSFPWSWFIRTLQFLQEFENGLMKDYVGLDKDFRFNRAYFYEETRCYRTLKKFLRNPYATFKLATPLKVARTKLSTDPRDKVYGLYGIFKHMQIVALPEVDYSKPVQHIYTEITSTAIRFDRSLDILYEVCLEPLIPGLSSWVPDRSNAAFIQPILSSTVYASRRSEPVYSFKGSKLLVSGILVDKLREVATSTSVCTPDFRRGYSYRMALGNAPERLSAIIELIRTLQEWIRISRQFHTYPTGELPQEAFYRTITQGCIPRPGDWALINTALEKWISIMTANFPDAPINIQTFHREVQVMGQYSELKDELIRISGCGGDVEEWADELKIRLIVRVYSSEISTLQQEAAQNSYQRTFLATEDGYMGIGPRWTQPGDSVALISGLNIPFIVRKEGQHYRLLGPVYIHGIMQGEHWDNAQTETITLV